MLFYKLRHQIEGCPQLILVLATALGRFRAPAALATELLADKPGDLARVQPAFGQIWRNAYLQAHALIEHASQDDHAGTPKLVEHHITHLADDFIIGHVHTGGDHRYARYLAHVRGQRLGLLLGLLALELRDLPASCGQSL